MLYLMFCLKAPIQPSHLEEASSVQLLQLGELDLAHVCQLARLPELGAEVVDVGVLALGEPVRKVVGPPRRLLLGGVQLLLDRTLRELHRERAFLRYQPIVLGLSPAKLLVGLGQPLLEQVKLGPERHVALRKRDVVWLVATVVVVVVGG